MAKIRINKDKCKGCYLCIVNCPNNLIRVSDELNIKGVRVKRFGLPDKFIEHGKREELFKKYNLTPDAICDVIVREIIGR